MGHSMQTGQSILKHQRDERESCHMRVATDEFQSPFFLHNSIEKTFSIFRSFLSFPPPGVNASTYCRSNFFLPSSFSLLVCFGLGDIFRFALLVRRSVRPLVALKRFLHIS